MKIYAGVDHNTGQHIAHKDSGGGVPEHGNMECGVHLNLNDWSKFTVPVQALDAGYYLCPDCFPDSDCHPPETDESRSGGEER